MLANEQTFYTPLAQKARRHSKYKPHIGAKEELRAQDRAYMQEAFGTKPIIEWRRLMTVAWHRSAPILCQARRSEIVRAPY